jgi:microcystin-dependent protein
MRHAQLWIEAATYPAALDRQLLGAIWGGAASRGCKVTPAGGLQVNIEPGIVVVPSQNNTGSTICVTDDVETVTMGAAPTGTTRMDLVLCHPYATDLDGGARNDWQFEPATGQSGPNPPVSPAPAGTVAIAAINRPSDSSVINAADIIDLRPGGVPVAGGDPVGVMAPFPGKGTLPSNYLLCDGRTDYLTTDYPELYVVLGNDYGGSAASNTFGVPDTRDRFMLGSGGAVSPVPGSRGGTRLITTSQMPYHGHGVTDNQHTHGVDQRPHQHDAHPATIGNYGSTQGLTAGGVTMQALASAVFKVQAAYADFGIAHAGANIGIQAAGGGQPYDPPYLGVVWIIKAR